MEWVDPEDPKVIAENELLGAAAAIEAVSKKLEQLKPRAKPKVAWGTEPHLNPLWGRPFSPESHSHHSCPQLYVCPPQPPATFLAAPCRTHAPVFVYSKQMRAWTLRSRSWKLPNLLWQL